MLLSIAVFFLFLCLTVLLYMSPEEKYYMKKRVWGRSEDKALEEKALIRRKGYLKRSMLLHDAVAGRYVDFQKAVGTRDEVPLGEKFFEALKTLPRQGLVREFEEVSSQLERLKNKRKE